VTPHKTTVGIAGNPNCGKSTLFNALTGASQQVGNWPGVTVEKKTGDYRFNQQIIKVVDLPGTYSLESSDDHVSPDEKVARDFIASGEAGLIINIVDASNIERNLYLTSQLLEMQVPMILALNMMDVVKQRGMKIDLDYLSQLLGCPVVPIAAVNKHGLSTLKETIAQALINPPMPKIHEYYQISFENAINELIYALQADKTDYRCNLRWLAIRLLEGDSLAREIASPAIAALTPRLQAKIEAESGDEIDIMAADARYSFVNLLTQNAVSRINDVGRRTTEKIDRVVLNRFLGIPIFLLVMYAMFMFTINIGSAFIDFFDQVVGVVLVDGLSELLSQWGLVPWLIVLLANGIGGGIQVVATFIPIVGFLFLFLSVLEDSGYMARAAFVMDRFMRMIGLPGKSFVPMIVGFGCNVPAIMATRTLESQRDRILTNLMNPFISCGARLPVYALFAAAFFPVGGQNIVFGLYLLGIGVAVLTGLIMRHTLFKGEVMPFIMELPGYHLPTLRGVSIRTWSRLRSFLFNAGKVIVPMVLILNFLNALGTDGSLGNENSDKSVLTAIGKSLTPVFRPIGINDSNWPATVGIFTGVLAKEAVVGTLNALYSQSAQSDPEEDKPFELKEVLIDASLTIPENFQKLGKNILDPLGININNVDEIEEVTTNTYAAMQCSFDGKAGAFAYLLFILLYTPCVTATAAIVRESGRNWALFTVFWTTGIAYMVAVVFYQSVTFNQHPEYSLAWIGGLMAVFASVLFGLWLYGKSTRPQHPQAVLS